MVLRPKRIISSPNDPCKLIRIRHRGPGNFYLWNPESGKFLLLESRTLSFGIRYSTQANRNPANGCNPESKFHAQNIWNLVAGIRNPRREIQNPRLCTGFFLSQCRDSLLHSRFLFRHATFLPINGCVAWIADWYGDGGRRTHWKKS